MPPRNTEPERTAHPFAFTLLYMPFGMSAGYVIVTLAYLLSHAGMSINHVAEVVALQLLPQTWKVLWAPLVDTTLTAKRWYVIATAGTGLFTLGTALVPAPASSIWLLGTLVLLSSVASSVSAMATEVLMAHATAEHQKGRAGGWSQAGNLGGSGLGGGAGLWMAEHVAPWSAGVVIGIACLLCCFALRVFPDTQQPRRAISYRDTLVDVCRDVWSLARSRIGFLTCLLFVLPIGTGAASNLWSAVADDWHASADVVALVNGVLGGVIAMAGCMVGGHLCDRMDRKTSYAVFGILQAVAAATMGYALKTPFTFIVFTSVYSFFNGFCYASFTAVTLETIGKGSAATKYNLLACFTNIPIAYMTLVDGQAQTRWGSAGMLYVEAILAVIAVALFAILTYATRAYATREPAPSARRNSA